MRNDATIDGRAVICRNSSLIGYSTNKAAVGAFIVYTVDGQTHFARMIGRVKFAPRIGAETKPVRNHILAMVLSSSGQSCYERWINPDDVREVYTSAPAELAAFFFAPKLPYDAQTMRRLMDHGTLQDQFIEQHAERVAMFAARDKAVQS